MAPEDVLISLGEVAAAFAGFSGVVGALGARSVSELPSFARFRFANLLMVSVSAALFAFLPVVLSQFQALRAVAWSGSSGALALFTAILFAHRLRKGSIARRAARTGAREIRPWLAAFWMILLFLVATSQLYSFAVAPREQASALYLAGILGLLVLSGVQFVSLALPRQTAEASAARGREPRSG